MAQENGVAFEALSSARATSHLNRPRGANSQKRSFLATEAETSRQDRQRPAPSWTLQPHDSNFSTTLTKIAFESCKNPKWAKQSPGWTRPDDATIGCKMIVMLPSSASSVGILCYLRWDVTLTNTTMSEDCRVETPPDHYGGASQLLLKLYLRCINLAPSPFSTPMEAVCAAPTSISSLSLS